MVIELDGYLLTPHFEATRELLSMDLAVVIQCQVIKDKNRARNPLSKLPYHANVQTLINLTSISSSAYVFNGHVEELMHVKFVKRQSPKVSVVLKFGEVSDNSGVVLFICPWFKLTKPVANSSWE
ncbi:hypothetical protein TNCV_575091 [Trichonephila clavipes]|nr:hypothetical protein TNCV_575091 [Trichonephila clavipes]